MSLHICLIIEQNTWVDRHIGDSLVAMGHTVRRLYYGASVCEFYGWSRRHAKKDKNQQLLIAIQQYHQTKPFDLIFCYTLDDVLSIECLKKISQLPAPLVVYNVDMACQWYRLIKTAPYFTYILCAQPDNMESLKKYNDNLLLFPMAVRPTLTPQIANVDFKPKAPVTFLGTPTIYRAKILSAIIHQNIPLAIYGKCWETQEMAQPIHRLEKTIHDIWYYGWARFKNDGVVSLFNTLKDRIPFNTIHATPDISKQVINAFLPDDLIGMLFRQSKINMGITRIIGDHTHKPGIHQMRLRDFEVPYAGGFYLVEEAPYYDTFFKPGHEVVTWRTIPDLIEKIKFYLKNDNERERISKNGQIRAQKEHTWANRFNMLFEKLNLSAKANQLQ